MTLLLPSSPRSYEDAIIDTVRFRREYDINRINGRLIEPIIKRNLMYVNGYDEHNRGILYVKFSEKIQTISGTQDYLRSVLLTALHSVERVDRLSTMKGSAEFVVVIDLNGLSWKTCPPLKTMSLAIGFLKRHFPYRLHAIYIVNASVIFDTIWKLIKPTVPARTLRKTFVLRKKEDAALLLRKLGDGLEEDYGGKTKVPDFNDERIFSQYTAPLGPEYYRH